MACKLVIKVGMEEDGRKGGYMCIYVRWSSYQSVSAADGDDEEDDEDNDEDGILSNNFCEN